MPHPGEYDYLDDAITSLNDHSWFHTGYYNVGSIDLNPRNLKDFNRHNNTKIKVINRLSNYCPKCGLFISEYWYYCPHCGEYIYNYRFNNKASSKYDKRNESFLDNSNNVDLINTIGHLIENIVVGFITIFWIILIVMFIYYAIKLLIEGDL